MSWLLNLIAIVDKVDIVICCHVFPVGNLELLCGTVCTHSTALVEILCHYQAYQHCIDYLPPLEAAETLFQHLAQGELNTSVILVSSKIATYSIVNTFLEVRLYQNYR